MKKLALRSCACLAAALLAFPAAAQNADTLQKIRQSGSVTMGVRDSSGALSYTLGNGAYVGYHVEVCQKVLADIQQKLGLSKLDTRYQVVTSANRVPLVQNGTVELECGSTTNNLARQKDVAFAVTTFVEEVRIAVKANAGIHSLKDLSGRNIVTTSGSTSVQTLRKSERTNGFDLKIMFGKDHADSFLLLESGRADAFVMDGSLLAGLIAKSRTPGDFKLVGEVLSVEPIAIMLRKDDAPFKKAVDDSLKQMMKSGELTRIYEKWLMQPIPPSNTQIALPMSDSLKAAIATPNDLPMEEYGKK